MSREMTLIERMGVGYEEIDGIFYLLWDIVTSKPYQGKRNVSYIHLLMV